MTTTTIHSMRSVRRLGASTFTKDVTDIAASLVNMYQQHIELCAAGSIAEQHPYIKINLRNIASVLGLSNSVADAKRIVDALNDAFTLGILHDCVPLALVEVAHPIYVVMRVPVGNTMLLAAKFHTPINYTVDASLLLVDGIGAEDVVFALPKDTEESSPLEENTAETAADARVKDKDLLAAGLGKGLAKCTPTVFIDNAPTYFKRR
jgi:hypothetical protein